MNYTYYQEPPMLDADCFRSSGPIVEVTLLSLHGITRKDKSTSKKERIAASVAFSGSATDMQVSSSTLCGRTGNLVVESQNVHIDDKVRSAASPSSKTSLVADFQDPGTDTSMSPLSHKLAVIENKACPHLRLRLPRGNRKGGTASLSSSNRDCRVVQDVPSVVESDTSSVESNHKGQSSLEDCFGAAGQSLMWTSSGAFMPEIVELNVAIKMEDGEIEQEGIAHLVFFGNQNYGYTKMDLPIKKKGSPDSPQRMSNTVALSPDAYLRVKVSVLSDKPSFGIGNGGGGGGASCSASQTSSSLYSNPLMIERQLSGILDQLRESEEIAAARQRAARMAMYHHQQQQQRHCHHQHLDEHEGRTLFPGSRFFLCGDFDWGKTFSAFSDAMTFCTGGGGGRRGRGQPGVQINCVEAGILQRNDTMASTILTRESLGI